MRYTIQQYVIELNSSVRLLIFLSPLPHNETTGIISGELQFKTDVNSVYTRQTWSKARLILILLTVDIKASQFVGEQKPTRSYEGGYILCYQKQSIINLMCG